MALAQRRSWLSSFLRMRYVRFGWFLGCYVLLALMLLRWVLG